MKNTKATLLARTVVVVAAICLSTTTAWAADGGTIDLADVPGSNLTYDDWTFDNTTNVYTILNNANVTVTGSNSGSQRRLAVADGATADITLSGVTIDVSATTNACAFDMTGATVTLTLSGTNTVKSGSSKAGLQVPSSATLTITAANTSQTLTATGGGGGAGIGGGAGASGGTITINDGTVGATGGTGGFTYGAGIGGGSFGDGGTITINSGMVTAMSGYNAAGIGGGGGNSGGTSGGSGGTITINGGTVTATGANNGAGIGGGMGTSSGGSGGTITISGGSVTAKSNNSGAGIGGSMVGAGGNITISGGSVKATKGTSSDREDIGPGWGGSGGTITITGGSVKGSSSPQPTNNATTPVYLTTLTVGSPATQNSGIAEGYISGVACAATPNAATGVYGIKDVETDGDGKVYFYLPASGNSGTDLERVRLTANGAHYGNDFARTDAGTAEILPALTLTPVAFTAQQTGGSSGDVSSTGVVLTFSEDVTNPNGKVDVAGATEGTVAGGGTSDTWTVPLTAVTAQGSAQVSVEDFDTYWIDNSPQTVFLYKDTQKPTVTSVSPSGATGVLVSTTNTLSVTFNEAMNTGVDGAVALSPAGTTLTKATTYWTDGGTKANYDLSGLDYGTTYTYDISVFEDVGGNEMDPVTAASSTFTFTTPTLQTITDATYSTAEPCVGNAITATAGTYAANNGGAEGAHTYQWYRADDNLGTSEAAIVSTTTLTTYTPVADDFGKYICIETTPVGSNGYPGVPVKSPWIQVGVRLRAGTVGGTQTPTAGITVASADSTVVYNTAAVDVALTKAFSTDELTWSASLGGGSFDNDASAITTYAPPASPSGNITLSATLNKAAAPDITFPTTGSTITYGDALSTSTLSLDGTAGRGSFAWQTPATLPTVANSGYAVEFTPSDLAQYDYSGVADWNGNKVVRTVGITVNKATLTVTADNKSKTYGDANPALTVAYSGFVNGDSESNLSVAPTASTTATTDSAVGTYPITVAGGTADNYAFTYIDGTLTIGKAAPPIITFPTTATTITYGEALSASTLSGGSTQYGTFNWTNGTIVPTVTNSGYSVTFTPNANTVANYNTITTTTATVALTVSKATLTITPRTGQSKVVGTPDPAYTYDTDGWKGSDGASLLTGALTRTAGDTVGAYAITQGMLTETSGNYTITFTAGITFAITLATSDNTKVSTVAVNGATLPVGAPNFYLADCGTTSAQITVTPEESTSQVLYDGTAGSTFSVDIARADIHEVRYTVQSTDGSTKEYTLQIESRFAFDYITGMKFDNVLYVNNNAAANGGYKFAAYEWYRNGQLIGDEQVYSAGDNRTDRLDPTADYSAIVTTIEGKVLHVCPSKVTLETTSPPLKAYPNPVQSGATITLESIAADGSPIRIYSITGGLIDDTKQLHNSKAQLTAPQATGIYLITVDGEMAKVVVKQ
ncbi:hypothetical protein FACS189452_04840 [Bacteroidia bacterium]|nr:hypothetical protein FACS189452_04840 [Bacteroidia bacterium]